MLLKAFFAIMAIVAIAWLLGRVLALRRSGRRRE
jgi:hypothetical protein